MNRKLRSIVGGVCAVSLLVGCALPEPEGPEQDFVPPREVVVVSLTREGLAYAKRSRLVDAELKLRQALYLAPDQFNILLNLAVVLNRQGLNTESAAIFRRLRKVKPRSLQVLSGLAHVYFSQYEFGEAERLYREALDIALDENLALEIATLSRSLSVVNFLRGDEEAALCWSSFAVRFRADAVQLQRHARLLMATDRTEDVIHFFQERQVKPVHSPELGVILAQAYLAEEKRDQALALVLMLDRHQELPPGVSLEFSLLKVLLFEEPEGILPEQREEFEEKKEKLFSILDEDPLENQGAVYWPTDVVDRLAVLFEEREAEKASQESSILWFAPGS